MEALLSVINYFPLLPFTGFSLLSGNTNKVIQIKYYSSTNEFRLVRKKVYQGFQADSMERFRIKLMLMKNLKNLKSALNFKIGLVTSYSSAVRDYISKKDRKRRGCIELQN